MNEIRRIQSAIGVDDWGDARIQRNFMAHDYPHLPSLWEYAWGPLKNAIEPVGFGVRNLLATIPPVEQQLDILIEVC